MDLVGDNDIVNRLHAIMCSNVGCGDLRISMTAKLAADEIERLRKERDEAMKKCEILESDVEALMNKRGLRVSALEKERDEARREVMSWIIDQACRFEDVDREYKKRGWEYLKEITND
jgi:hypothetical protein